MIVNNGIHAGMSSDGMQIAPMNPWLHMYYAITGLNARQVLINGGKQITRQEALKLYTANNGWFLREEDRADAASTGSVASRSQSNARDSLCSLRLEPAHVRLIGREAAAACDEPVGQHQHARLRRTAQDVRGW